MANNLQLGDRVAHRIHGFSGIVTGITEYLQQCRQVLVTPEKLGKDGNPIGGKWYDEPWLDLVKRGVYLPKAAVEVQGKKRLRVSGAPDREHPEAHV